MPKALPPDCVGSNPELSWVLYRVFHEFTPALCIGEVYRIACKYGSDLAVEHFVLLPDDAFHWTLRQLVEVLEEQASTPSSYLTIGTLFVADGDAGIGEMEVAPKAWASSFVRDILARRPLPGRK